ncbi:MFS transporter [Ameyamaea chiangmaiensis]|nr:MFS transporter [Ameyamaea chiangmaiensis]
MRQTFRTLRIHNYRLWAMGALVSNIGTWMQRVAQDWVVLTHLTAHDASAVGIVMALQFGPIALLLPLSGLVADRCDRRKVLMLTQAAMGMVALGAGSLLLLGRLTLWEVWGFALLLGITTAFDSPSRQTFVAEMVGEAELANAVALNSASFNLGRMLGPAVAGGLLAVLGAGWVFVLNAGSFGAVLLALGAMRTQDLHRGKARAPGRTGLAAGFAYVRRRRDLTAIVTMLFLIGTFGLNFPIYIATMAVTTFHVGAGQFGLLTTLMASGSVVGALVSAGWKTRGMALLVRAACAFGTGCALAAVMPRYALFGLMLVPLGIATQIFNTSANALVQMGTAPEMRGRVMAIVLGLALGGTLIGAPFVGWVADALGPRWAMGVGALAGLMAAAVGGVQILHARETEGEQTPGARPARRTGWPIR